MHIIQIPPIVGKHHPGHVDHIDQGFVCPEISKHHTLDNSLLNVPIGLSIRCGVAYRYLL